MVEDIPLVEFMYLVFTRMPGKSYRRRLRSLLLYLCDVFRALINSLVCWFCASALGIVLFQIFITMGVFDFQKSLIHLCWVSATFHRQVRFPLRIILLCFCIHTLHIHALYYTFLQKIWNKNDCKRFKTRSKHIKDRYLFLYFQWQLQNMTHAHAFASVESKQCSPLWKMW